MLALHLIGILASVATATATAPPEPTQTALRPGEDRQEYTQRYDQWLSTVPPEDRAWEVLEQVYTQLAETQLGSPDAGKADTKWSPTPETLNALPQLVEQLHAVLDRPVLGIPSHELGVNTDDDSEEAKLLIGLLLPHIPMLRVETELLLLDTQRAAEQQNHDRILTNLRTLRHLASIGSVAYTLIEGLGAIENDREMSELILNDTLDLRSWNTHSLESLARIYNAPPAWEPVRRFIDAERAIYANFLDWIYTDSRDGQLTLAGAERLLSLDPDPDRDKLVAQIVQHSVGPREAQEQAIDTTLNAAIRDITEPIADKPELISRRILDDDGPYSPKGHGLRFMPAAYIMAAMDRSAELVLDARVKRDAAILLIAAHRHRTRHGKLPQSTQDIDQDLLTHTPTDPYSDDPLQLKNQNARLLIYSLGPDRDDDRGRPLAEHRFVLSREFSQFDDAQQEQWDGDWVFTTNN